MKPVVEIQHRPQQVVTYRDIAQTEYRTEPRTETVPVTRYHHVTADEGSYQTVWVPKMVTKQVARTEYQQRTTYRSVPYQVTRRVPQYTTQIVPQRTVRYVPQQYQTALHAPGCSTCGPLSQMTTFLPHAPTTAVATLPPVISAVPVKTPPTQPQVAAGPVPDPQFAQTQPLNDYTDWTNISPKTDPQIESHRDRLVGYEAVPLRESKRASRSANRRSGMFVPAPSAAMVWQSQQATSRR